MDAITPPGAFGLPKGGDMKRFRLEIELENDAFRDSGELPRILRAVAKRIEDGEIRGTVRDVNGNTCGSWKKEMR